MPGAAGFRKNLRTYGPEPPGSAGVRAGKKDYRSETFSTTRTLSPRTVIGIGTTLS